MNEIKWYDGMKYEVVDFTRKQRLEAIRLMLGVASVPMNVTFDMNSYASIKVMSAQFNAWDPLTPDTIRNECGSSACFMGHAPFFCKEQPNQRDWDEYRHDLFGDGDMDSDLSQFLFGTSWSDSIEQAYTRMYIVLTKGIPCDFIAGDSMMDWEIYDVPPLRDIKYYAVEYGVTIEEVTKRALKNRK